MKVLIIDDEKEFAEYIRNRFISYFSYLNENLDVSIITERFDNVLSFKSPDIVFIDVNLGNHSGINLAKYIKNAFPNSIFIFMSNYDELVFSTLSVGIFQLIRKKQADKDIPEVFHQLKEYISSHFHKALIKFKGRTYVIHLKDIEYILSIGHDLIIQTSNNDYTISSSIDNFIKNNYYMDFVQIQRNLVINLAYTKHVEKSHVIMNNDMIHKVGRTYQNQLMEKYEEYLLR